MDVNAERRAVADRDARPVVVHLSEEERIEAAQFLLGTRQREEAAVRSTHLLREPSPDDEEHARETLAEMIHLQEAISARSGEMHPDVSAQPSSLPRALTWALVATLLLAAGLLVAWVSGIF
jgi:hypothetical protein